MGRSRSRMRRHTRSGAMGCVIAMAMVAAACSGDDGSTDQDSSVDTTVVDDGGAVPAPADDGSLTIGVLLPLTGPGSELGTAMSEAIEIARQEIVLADLQFRDVRLIPVDESTLDGAVTPSLQEIFADDVDAVIGPASSLLAARLAPITVSAGVFTCSPTASAMSLDDLPDTGPLFVRTIPSESMQAEALARQLDGTGGNIMLAYVDDAYGRAFLELVQQRLQELGAPVAVPVAFDPFEPDYTATARDIVTPGTATIGIIGDAEAGPRLVQSLADVIDPTVLTSIWMNDAMRVPATASAYRRLADSPILPLMAGVSPRSTIEPTSATASSVLPDDGRFFAANAYDCMNLIALAAHQAEFVNGAGMADQVVQITNGGTPCTSFPTCAAELSADRGIDYDGPSGALDIGRSGDPTLGLFDVYRFDGRGVDVTIDAEPIRVSLNG